MFPESLHVKVWGAVSVSPGEGCLMNHRGLFLPGSVKKSWTLCLSVLMEEVKEVWGLYLSDPVGSE